MSMSVQAMIISTAMMLEEFDDDDLDRFFKSLLKQVTETYKKSKLPERAKMHNILHKNEKQILSNPHYLSTILLSFIDKFKLSNQDLEPLYNLASNVSVESNCGLSKPQQQNTQDSILHSSSNTLLPIAKFLTKAESIALGYVDRTLYIETQKKSFIIGRRPNLYSNSFNQMIKDDETLVIDEILLNRIINQNKSAITGFAYQFPLYLTFSNNTSHVAKHKQKKRSQEEKKDNNNNTNNNNNFNFSYYFYSNDDDKLDNKNNLKYNRMPGSDKQKEQAVEEYDKKQMINFFNKAFYSAREVCITSDFFDVLKYIPMNSFLKVDNTSFSHRKGTYNVLKLHFVFNDGDKSTTDANMLLNRDLISIEFFVQNFNAAMEEYGKKEEFDKSHCVIHSLGLTMNANKRTTNYSIHVNRLFSGLKENFDYLEIGGGSPLEINAVSFFDIFHSKLEYLQIKSVVDITNIAMISMDEGIIRQVMIKKPMQSNINNNNTNKNINSNGVQLQLEVADEKTAALKELRLNLGKNTHQDWQTLDAVGLLSNLDTLVIYDVDNEWQIRSFIGEIGSSYGVTWGAMSRRPEDKQIGWFRQNLAKYKSQSFSRFRLKRMQIILIKDYSFSISSTLLQSLQNIKDYLVGLPNIKIDIISIIWDIYNPDLHLEFPVDYDVISHPSSDELKQVEKIKDRCDNAKNLKYFANNMTIELDTDLSKNSVRVVYFYLTKRLTKMMKQFVGNIDDYDNPYRYQGSNFRVQVDLRVKKV